jgi:hypothetical protein
MVAGVIGWVAYRAVHVVHGDDTGFAILGQERFEVTG